MCCPIWKQAKSRAEEWGLLRVGPAVSLVVPQCSTAPNTMLLFVHVAGQSGGDHRNWRHKGDEMLAAGGKAASVPPQKPLPDPGMHKRCHTPMAKLLPIPSALLWDTDSRDPDWWMLPSLHSPNVSHRTCQALLWGTWPKTDPGLQHPQFITPQKVSEAAKILQ